ncbi:hypothetical protein HQ560_01460 [bacterium]|nr:hypothetical protein [bacterium]
MKQRIVQIAVVIALVAGAVLLRNREQALPETPEAAVNAFFDAAERGDDTAYLTLVDGELRSRFENARSELGPERFRADLQRQAAGVKGLGTMRADDAPEGLVGIDVTIVFTDRNETQRFTLAPRNNGWIITNISTTNTSKPSIPYGTPVYAE